MDKKTLVIELQKMGIQVKDGMIKKSDIRAALAKIALSAKRPTTSSQMHHFVYVREILSKAYEKSVVPDFISATVKGDTEVKLDGEVWRFFPQPSSIMVYHDGKQIYAGSQKDEAIVDGLKQYLKTY